MRALITRPRENAGAIARALSERDIEPIQEPLLEIRATEHGPIDFEGIQAILLTSVFGARELAASTDRRDLPILAVGDATAKAARDAGFAQVESARGDAEALVALAIDRLKPADGALLHAGGRTVAGDLPGQLGEAGFEVRRVELYAALPAPALSIETTEALKAGQIDLVLFFSPRTAATFVRLVGEAGLADRCTGVTALCLSEQVAESARGLTWHAIEVADRPEQPAMVALVDRWLETHATDAADDTPSATSALGSVAPEQTTPPEPEPAAAAPAAAGAASAAFQAGPQRRPEIRWQPHRSDGSDQARAEPDRTHTTQAASAPPPARSHGRAIGLLTAALVLMLLAGAAFGWHLWQEQAALRVAFEQGQRSRLPSTEITDLQGRIGSLEARTTENLTRIEQRLTDRIEEASARIEAVAARVEEAARQQADVAELNSRIEDLGTRIAAVQEARTDLQGKLEAVESTTGQLGERLTSSLAQIEEQVTAATEAAREASRDRTAAMLLALNGIRDALADGEPFATHVADLRRLAAEQPAVTESLSGWTDRAETGIPTGPQLRQRFDELTAEVAGRLRPQTGESWLDSMLERAASVVRVRRVGDDVQGDDTQAVLARAEAALDRNDLAAAVAEVEKLQGEDAAAFAEWLAAARARLDAVRGMERLEKAAVGAEGAG